MLGNLETFGLILTCFNHERSVWKGAFFSCQSCSAGVSGQ